MKKYRSRAQRIFVLSFALFVVVWACHADLAIAADKSQMLVGSWYGERIHSGQFSGKSFNHRRWLTVHRSDGSARDVHRYYLDDTMQGEYVEEYKWGVKKNIYWNICQSQTINGVVNSCSDRSEYEIQSLTSREFRYRSLKSQIVYSMVRVPEEFRLP
ncbi:MAG: hypothetical protein A2169_13840 [Deltaproteobacteria bacterium RBG_13_47_9]|nr:MAG: hypothetical protein A2169_13840 [Deltaproteobacteria bacterium RBG_13_47_9]